MKPTPKKILFHLLLFIGICSILLIGVHYWLNRYTHHNSAILVPDVTDLYVEEADVLFQEKGLRYEVVDSIHVDDKAPGVIIEQKPEANAKVKINRIIFLTINAEEERTIPLPYVKDFSQRQAVATLEAVGLKVSRIRFVPSEYRNLVLDVKYDGNSIEAGTPIPAGSNISLVVGQGQSSEKVLIPDFFRMPLDSAILFAHASNVNIGDISYDVTPKNEKEALKYFIYKQEPEAGTYHTIGKRIQIWMTQNADLLYPENTLPAQEFYQ